MIPAKVYAGEFTGARTISHIGCHLNDDTCFVELDGSPVGGSVGCATNSVRWAVNTKPSGKSWLALFTAAHLTGKKVGLQIDGCHTQPAFPTFSYGYVY